ncbi:hypothetical protein Tdes44962_MAKER06456 [Teratosphaeria destructans]|uniref:Uncharacterized protein n=1 Tax=Teratosphaeria destructans TaxID=418781 RepID=A0A9W7T299_9PEZI|nr:hypothetical protein Tdes44962_MAKER06456 [Teratosphaeria destructans]
MAKLRRWSEAGGDTEVPWSRLGPVDGPKQQQTVIRARYESLGSNVMNQGSVPDRHELKQAEQDDRELDMGRLCSILVSGKDRTPSDSKDPPAVGDLPPPQSRNSLAPNRSFTHGLSRAAFDVQRKSPGICILQVRKHFPAADND